MEMFLILKGHETIPFHNGTLGNPRYHMQILLFRKTDFGLRFISCCLQLDCLNAIPQPQLNKRGTLKKTPSTVCVLSLFDILGIITRGTLGWVLRHICSIRGDVLQGIYSTSGSPNESTYRGDNERKSGLKNTKEYTSWIQSDCYQVEPNSFQSLQQLEPWQTTWEQMTGTVAYSYDLVADEM